MKHGRLFFIVGTISVFAVAVPSKGQSLTGGDAMEAVEGRDLSLQLRERQEKNNRLSTEEKQALGQARVKALDDPAVKAALAARNEAVREFQAALRASMLKSEPTLAPVFQKMAATARRR